MEGTRGAAAMITISKEMDDDQDDGRPLVEEEKKLSVGDGRSKKNIEADPKWSKKARQREHETRFHQVFSNKATQHERRQKMEENWRVTAKIHVPKEKEAGGDDRRAPVEEEKKLSVSEGHNKKMKADFQWSKKTRQREHETRFHQVFSNKATQHERRQKMEENWRVTAKIHVPKEKEAGGDDRRAPVEEEKKLSVSEGHNKKRIEADPQWSKKSQHESGFHQDMENKKKLPSFSNLNPNAKPFYSSTDPALKPYPTSFYPSYLNVDPYAKPFYPSSDSGLNSYPNSLYPSSFSNFNPYAKPLYSSSHPAPDPYANSFIPQQHPHLFPAIAPGPAPSTILWFQP